MYKQDRFGLKKTSISLELSPKLHKMLISVSWAGLKRLNRKCLNMWVGRMEMSPVTLNLLTAWLYLSVFTASHESIHIAAISLALARTYLVHER